MAIAGCVYSAEQLMEAVFAESNTLGEHAPIVGGTQSGGTTLPGGVPPSQALEDSALGTLRCIFHLSPAQGSGQTWDIQSNISFRC